MKTDMFVKIFLNLLSNFKVFIVTQIPGLRLPEPWSMYPRTLVYVSLNSGQFIPEPWSIYP